MISVVALLGLVVGAHASDWGYTLNGSDWTGTCASGTHQSPVNLDTYSSVRFTFALHVSENSIPDTGRVVNNGHTMVYYPNTDGAVTVLNPMDGDVEYTLAQFHCHWDATATADISLGSEHTKDTVAYPLECHFVHYRTSYGDLTEAVTHDHGLMVIGQFYEIDNTAIDTELDKFLNAAPNVTAKDATFNLTETLAIVPLMTNNSEIYTYSGSLTTPTCNEVVQWYVFRTPMGVALTQLQKLWALEKDNSSTIAHNWRPTQSLHGRSVHRNFAYQQDDDHDDHEHTDDHGESSGVNTGAIVTLVLLGLASPFLLDLLR